MKHRLLTLVTLGATLLLGACTPSDARDPLTRDLDDFEEHVAAFEDALGTHASDIQGAATLVEMMDIEDAHAVDAQMHMGDMSADIDHMGTCTNSHGHSPDTGEMDELMAAAMNEHDAHRTAMAAAPDMAAAGTEEARHQAAMADVIGMMKQAKVHMTDQEMMAGAGMHMCPMGGE